MKTIQEAKYIAVSAGVRYWEDATVNGVEDEHGNLIPFRDREKWCPTIDLEEGKIIDWPIGTEAEIHYKVCDDGEYWIQDKSGSTTHKWNGSYVPDDFLCHGSRGYGDYIIMNIEPGGKIKNWRKPVIKREDWSDVN